MYDIGALLPYIKIVNFKLFSFRSSHIIPLCELVRYKIFRLIRPGDKPATDPRSHEPYLAATLSIFKSLLQENPPILWLPEFRQLPENIHVYNL